MTSENAGVDGSDGGIDRCDEPTCSAWAQVVVQHSEDSHSKLCEVHGTAFSHDEKVGLEEWKDGVRRDGRGGRVQTDGGRAKDGDGDDGGVAHEDAWREIDECEVCGEGDAPLRAIKMRVGRRKKLCLGCFTHKLEEGEVDPTDPRVDGDPGRPRAPGQTRPNQGDRL